MANSAFYPYSIISQLCINNLRLLSHRPCGLSFFTIKIPYGAPSPCTSNITAEGIQNCGRKSWHYEKCLCSYTKTQRRDTFIGKGLWHQDDSGTPGPSKLEDHYDLYILVATRNALGVRSPTGQINGANGGPVLFLSWRQSCISCKHFRHWSFLDKITSEITCSEMLGQIQDL